MKKILLTLVVFVAALASSAQSVIPNGWHATFEPVSDANELNGIKTAASADGSVYVSSTYNKAFTFGGKEVADPEGLTSACIVKYNEKGQEQWAVALEGSAVVYALDTDADGTLYAAGSFMDKVVYAGTDGEKAEITSEGVYSAFIAKIDNNGKFGIVKVITPIVNEEIASKMGDPWGMGEESPLYSMWDPIYVTPNKIQVDGEKVYVSAKYMGDVKELDWKGSYIDVFGMMYSDNYSMGVFSLKKADFTEAVNIANVQATGIVTDMQYYPEALDFTAENGTVYVGFFGFGNLTLATPVGNKDFTFGISADESGNKEHAFVLATIGSDVNAKVFNTEMHAKDAKPYKVYMEKSGDNLFIGGTFFGQLPFDAQKNSGELASDIFTASVKAADFSTNWTFVGQSESDALSMSVNGETVLISSKNIFHIINIANGEVQNTKEQTLIATDACGMTCLSAISCSETVLGVSGKYNATSSEGETSIDTWIASFEPVSDAKELNGIKTASAADGSVYVSSTYNKGFTFGGKEVADPEGLTSACIVKYNEKGQEQWAVALEGSAVVYALDTDADGTLYAAGSFIDVVKYTGTDGTTGELAGGADAHSAFVAKISKDGKVESVKTIAPVINAAILESFMYFPEPNYVYVTPNNIQIDGEKVYVSATYTADVEELGWKAAYLNVFDFMYMENKSAGIFSLDKANLANPTSVATVQNTENISYNQYYPEALDFTAENGTVYVGFFGFGNLTMATPAGNKDFTFGISTDESGNKEHAFVLATIGSDVNAKVFNTEMHAKDAKPYNVFMDIAGDNLLIGGTYYGQLPFDTSKNSGELASDVFMTSVNKADAFVNWTVVGAKEAEATCMAAAEETAILSTTANEFFEVNIADGEVLRTEPQMLDDADAYAAICQSIVYRSEGKVYVKGRFNSSANAIEDVKAPSLQSEGHSYNMAGQRVGKNYKGIVIKNGKKYLVK